MLLVASLLAGCATPLTGGPPNYGDGDADTDADADTGTDTGSDTGGETGETGNDSGGGAATIVVVVLDTARYQLFEQGTMPHLYGRRAQGLYVDTFAAVEAWTLPTTASLMSGVRLEERGLDPDDKILPRGAVRLVSEAFQKHGWATLMASANEVMSANLFEGFDEKLMHSYEWSLADQTAEVISWLEGVPEAQPRFVWMQAMNLHVPYDKLHPSCEAAAVAADAECPENVIHTTGAGGYVPGAFTGLSDAETAACSTAIELAQRCVATQVDLEIDALIQALPGDALIVVVSDHGEGWLDPSVEHNWGASVKLTRSFLLMLHPSLAGQVVPLASQVDLAPTLLKWAGLDYASADIEGVPIGEPLLEPPTTWHCDEYGHLAIAAWDETYQLVYNDYNNNQYYELFALADDPAGDMDLAYTVALPDALVAALDAKAERNAALCP
ncbi:MAG: hypothetical protein EXR71_19560 [Myxococcales bacterium]|nr:hypothetical protein [Myxococcales bacterium]